MKLSNINIYDIDDIMRTYLTDKHPKDSNGFIIRIADKITDIYTRRRTYIINFPIINDDNRDNIVNKWSEYALDNIIDNYDLNHEFTITSIDPIKVSKEFNDVRIQYGGHTVNPEDFIRSIAHDIIEQMNKHLIELYMDETYPEIDIYDSEQKEQFNEIFDMIDMKDLYEKYKFANVYVPISMTNDKTSEDIIFYLNGTIKTSTQIIDIIDEIRLSLDFDDINEVLKYEKEDIIYKYGSNNELKNFTIISDPDI